MSFPQSQGLSTEGGAATGALSGASAGMMLGPWGALIGAGVGAGMGAMQAKEQNSSLERAMAAQAAAAEVSQTQNVQQAALERLKRARLAHQIEGKLRVATGATGVNLDSLSRQNAQDANTDASLIDANLANNILAIRSGTQANLTSLESQTINPLLAGFMGSLEGLNTGLSLGSSLDELRRRPE